jgi:PncC family amidohydrolase
MTLASAARRVARALAAADLKVVFAESCTGGLVSAALTQVPGISAHHCGGVVVYRDATKVAFLGVPPRLLERPGPVSEEVTRLLAEHVLERTPEADIALGITGHLGPQAQAGLDGRVFVAVAWRAGRGGKRTSAQVKSYQCRSEDGRVARQRWAAEQALVQLVDATESRPS